MAVRPKDTRVRLDALSYENLRRQILRRDGWRCQSCGTMSNLEVHHKEFRSHSGSNSRRELNHAVRVVPRQSALLVKPLTSWTGSPTELGIFASLNLLSSEWFSRFQSRLCPFEKPVLSR